VADRRDIEQRLIVDGRPYVIRLISNPTIDDVLVTEARIRLSEIESGSVDSSRQVKRDVRDLLIRIGVER
jgi:hypothetical protein